MVKKTTISLQQCQRDVCAGLRIGKRVMVVLKVIAAGSGDCVQLVVRQQASEMAARGAAGAIKFVIRIVHLIDPEHSFQATLVKGAVVRH